MGIGNLKGLFAWTESTKNFAECQLLDQLGRGIGGAKPGQPHDLPQGGHAPVRAVERDNGGEMRAGIHQGSRVG
jgi:hypothetical protein